MIVLFSETVSGPEPVSIFNLNCCWGFCLFLTNVRQYFARGSRVVITDSIQAN